MPRDFREQARSGQLPADDRNRTIYEQVFVLTALRLRGIREAPTPSQWETGKKLLYFHDLKVAVQGIRQSAGNPEAFARGLVERNAIADAFMLVRFDSVQPPTEEQAIELSRWLANPMPAAHNILQEGAS
jgi:hypothetical protein